MSLSMYQASAPRFANTLQNLAAILDKAKAHAAAKKIDEQVLTSARLFPDMFALTRNAMSAPDILGLVDYVIFNILASNTDAHAKNHSMILTAGPRMAPLYDVSTVLMWDHVNQHHAQKLAGRKRKPVDMDRGHWDQIANDASLGARGVRLRVQELIDAMVASRVAATALVAGQPGAMAGIVEEIAALVEGNALRIAGRL